MNACATGSYFLFKSETPNLIVVFISSYFMNNNNTNNSYKNDNDSNNKVSMYMMWQKKR